MIDNLVISLLHLTVKLLLLTGKISELKANTQKLDLLYLLALTAVIYVPPKQYRLYGRRFLQVKRLNQQYQSTEGTYSTQIISFNSIATVFGHPVCGHRPIVCFS